MKTNNTHNTKSTQEIIDINEFSDFLDSILQGHINEGLFDKFKDKLDFIKNLAGNLKLGFKELLKFFKDKNIISFFNGIKWSFARLFDLLKSGFEAYRALIKAIFEFTSKNKIVKWTSENLKKLDDWLKTHPKLKRLGGFAVSAILVYIWLNMTFTGDYEYDFDFSDIINAILGEYTLETIFSGPKGVQLLTLFASGVFLGLSFPWGGSTSLQMIFAVIKTLNDKFKIIKIQGLKIKMFSEALATTLIKDLKKTAEEEPTFIFLIGGTGAGKNFVYNKFLEGIRKIDLDEYTSEFGKEFNTDPRKQVSRAAAKSKNELQDAFNKKQSIVQMGTGNNIDSSSNKFKWAKDAGMKVVVVLVDAEKEMALMRNIERNKNGDPRIVPDDKVIRTVEVAKLNTDIYRKDPNVDSVIVYKN